MPESRSGDANAIDQAPAAERGSPRAGAGTLASHKGGASHERIGTPRTAATIGNGSDRAADAFLRQWPSPTGGVLVVLGAPGTNDYRRDFDRTAAFWIDAATRSSLPHRLLQPQPDSGRRLRELLREIAEHDRAAAPSADDRPNGRATSTLWLVLIGHGTFDGRTARFNLAGPDVSAEELAGWLEPIGRPQVVVCGFSCSGAFLPKLSAPGRVVVSATKSGTEHLYSRFGRFFAEAVTTSEGDLDKDGRTSVWEAFLAASRRTERFYRSQGRLATEHPLLDDNGDGQGVRAAWFDGLYPRENLAVQGPLDGIAAHQVHLVAPPKHSTLSNEQRSARQRLESELRALRAKRSRMTEADYLDALERIFLQLADVYAAADVATTPR
ncbi:MAG: hypothetical protein D6725_02960 [Planctomycetota bacterium]|nr:MAG: hypothetical protein D6725_02960 [Planctomycetota bacterium]